MLLRATLEIERNGYAHEVECEGAVVAAPDEEYAVECFGWVSTGGICAADMTAEYRERAEEKLIDEQRNLDLAQEELRRKARESAHYRAIDAWHGKEVANA